MNHTDELMNTHMTLREYLQSKEDEYFNAWFIKSWDSGFRTWTGGDYLLHIEEWSERQKKNGNAMLVQDVRDWLDGEVHVLRGDVYLRIHAGEPLIHSGISPWKPDLEEETVGEEAADVG